MSAEKDHRPTVVVVGAGLIGTLSAYWLARSNKYNVVCIDKAKAPALATSKGNAGRFCPSLLGDFAPTFSALKSMLSSGSNVAWSPSVVFWGIKYVDAAIRKQKHINESLNELGIISTRLMDHLTKDVIDLDKTLTNIWVYGDANGISKGVSTLKATRGATFTLLDAEKCSRLTSMAMKVFGSTGGCIQVNSDYTANARDFTMHIYKASADLGCQFKFESRVENVIRGNNGKLKAVELDNGSIVPCDYVVVACGPWSGQFMKKWFNKSIPVMPVRGASLELDGVENGPNIGFSDNTSGAIHFQATPYGSSKLRLAGFADVVGEPSPNTVDVECSDMYKKAFIARLKATMPDVKWKTASPLWCGLRPMSPDRLPIIGPSGIPDVFLNVGHGAIGWTLAAASGYLLCNSMLEAHGHAPLGIDLEADKFKTNQVLTVDRFFPL